MFVASAGNEGESQPGALAALPIYVRDHLRRAGRDDRVSPL